MEGMHLDPGLYLYEFARYSQAHLSERLSRRKSLRSPELQTSAPEDQHAAHRASPPQDAATPSSVRDCSEDAFRQELKPSFRLCHDGSVCRCLQYAPVTNSRVSLMPALQQVLCRSSRASPAPAYLQMWAEDQHEPAFCCFASLTSDRCHAGSHILHSGVPSVARHTAGETESNMRRLSACAVWAPAQPQAARRCTMTQTLIGI